MASSFLPFPPKLRSLYLSQFLPEFLDPGLVLNAFFTRSPTPPPPSNSSIPFSRYPLITPCVLLTVACLQHPLLTLFYLWRKALPSVFWICSGSPSVGTYLWMSFPASPSVLVVPPAGTSSPLPFQHHFTLAPHKSDIHSSGSYDVLLHMETPWGRSTCPGRGIAWP
ncbi:hypothetical protein BT96DRAFT_1022069 [Gymnopus androsaceus JB14]|uniref:Uncharacterized protein n=1 Tax=Gymnopus androsaceus JB14 TaxID=1447944 RepID=A0A6A4HD51_9AGAR|nr:hypothetical protein BT96DRAFT_1022069 [Gymnopus androsaceus JB14]